VSCQAGIRKASESEPLTKRRKTIDDIETGVCACLRDEPGGCPLTGQAVSGVKAARAWSAASTGNGGRRASILWLGSLGEVSGWREGARRAAETVRR
jgi:hypothetical protein